MRALLLPLLLAGCSPEHGAGIHDGVHMGHDAPDLSSVAADTSDHVEMMRSIEIAYAGAAVSYEIALRQGLIDDTALDLEARAKDGLDYLRTLEHDDEAFLATYFYVNNSIEELVRYVEREAIPAEGN